MRYIDIKATVQHLVKHNKCLKCNARFVQSDVTLLASTKYEGLFEISCTKCKTKSILSVELNRDEASGDDYRNQAGIKITTNDVLDIKNFLNNFDGNFKKIFHN